MNRPAVRLAQAAALFFASGALGLGYELIWIRKAALVVGASQIAMSTVLTSFFVGLGIGSLVIGRRRRSTRWSPLVVYGLFEVGIGLYALAFPWLFDAVEATYAALYPLAAGHVVTLFALRFVLLFLLCLPPTFMMGGTLPLLLDGLVDEDRRIGSRTSLLYGINILGAVAGVLATSYFAIPFLGMNGTSRIAGLGNLALGGLAVWLFRAVRPLHEPDAPVGHPAGAYTVMAAATGAVAIAWQIVHARFFSLLDVTTIYTTALLLAIWLLGLAAGSLLLAPLLGARARALRIVAGAQALVPVVGLFSFRASRLVDFSQTLGAQRAEDGSVVQLDTMQVMPNMALFSEELDAIFFGPLLRIGLVVLLPVVLLGACLPALIAAATARTPALRSIAGTLVFWNTLGSSAGAFLAGYVLLPALGMHGSLTVLGATSLAIAFAAWGLDARAATASGWRGVVPALIGVGLVAVLAFAIRTPDLTRHAIENYGYGSTVGDYELAEVVEDAIGTAYIYENEEHIVLGEGAVAFASADRQGLSAQAIQGHLPVMLLPGEGPPRDCLGIGIGSGQSLGALLMYPIERLDVVDIFPGLVDLSLRHFREFNHGLATDPRVRFHDDDGRHFVQRAGDARYDVISMEPPPPRADGVYSLYSLDFYRQARRILTDRGVLMQWLPLYRVSPLDARSIVKTQAEIFPETFIVKQGDEDFMLLSYKTRPTFVVDEMRRRAEIFRTEREVAGRRWSPDCEYEIASFEGMASALLAGPEAIRAMEAPDLYEDDTQRLCFGSGDRWLLRRYRGAVSRISFAALPESPMVELAGYFSPPLDSEQIVTLGVERAFALDFYNVTDPQRIARYEAAVRSGRNTRERVHGTLGLAAAHDIRLQKHEAIEQIKLALGFDPSNADPRDVALVRRIVRNHFAVYRNEVAAFIDGMQAIYPDAPLVRSMRTAFDEADRFEEVRRARYLFPDH